MNKIEAILKSNKAKEIVGVIGSAAINLAIGLVIVGVYKTGVTLVGIAADSIVKNAESV